MVKRRSVPQGRNKGSDGVSERFGEEMRAFVFPGQGGGVVEPAAELLRRLAAGREKADVAKKRTAAKG